MDVISTKKHSEIWSSVKTGWRVLEMFLAFIIRLWVLFLFALLIYIVCKKYGHTIKSWFKNKPRN